MKFPFSIFGLFTWLALQKVLSFIGGDMRNSCKDVAAVGCCTFDTVSMVDASLACFMVHVKVPEVVVEIYGSGAEIATEQGGMRGEDGRDVNMTLATQGNSHAGEPLVKVGNDSSAAIISDELDGKR